MYHVVLILYITYIIYITKLYYTYTITHSFSHTNVYILEYNVNIKWHKELNIHTYICNYPK